MNYFEKKLEKNLQIKISPHTFVATKGKGKRVMEKKDWVALWRTDLGDDKAIADEVAKIEGLEKCKPQHVRHWRTSGKNKSKYDEAILAICAERFKGRKLVRRLVPVIAELPVA